MRVNWSQVDSCVCVCSVDDFPCDAFIELCVAWAHCVTTAPRPESRLAFVGIGYQMVLRMVVKGY